MYTQLEDNTQNRDPTRKMVVNKSERSQLLSCLRRKSRQTDLLSSHDDDDDDNDEVYLINATLIAETSKINQIQYIIV